MLSNLARKNCKNSSQQRTVSQGSRLKIKDTKIGEEDFSLEDLRIKVFYDETTFDGLESFGISGGFCSRTWRIRYEGESCFEDKPSKIVKKQAKKSST